MAAKKEEITISGTGFLEDSTVVLKGKKYTPSVNQAGTQLLVTIPSRGLSIGPYAITVSNRPGMETTLKKRWEFTKKQTKRPDTFIRVKTPDPLLKLIIFYYTGYRQPQQATESCF